MNRRKFLSNCGAAAMLSGSKAWYGRAYPGLPIPEHSGLDESAIGQPVNLASYGELKSWLSPEVIPTLQEYFITGPTTRSALNLSDVPWKYSQFDMGVEWPEFRTIDKVVLEYAAENNTPSQGKQFLEYWTGITARQGSWNAVEESAIEGAHLEKNGRIWTFLFSPRRTCKVRLRFQDQKQVAIKKFAVYGQSRWKSGEIRIEWGHRGPETSYDGRLTRYNGEVLDIQPFGNTQMAKELSWTSTAGDGKISGIVAKVLYAWGADPDRSILTLRTKACEVSFLPGEVLEAESIDIPDFGVYVRKSSLNLDRASYRRKNHGKERIVDAVAKHPEQTLENAYQHIRASRVTLSFVGVDSNSHKFGIAPDGHLVVGYDDPSFGHPMAPKFAVYFDTTDQPALFEKPVDDLRGLFDPEKPKQQSLEEGWLPIIITSWSENELAFERTDYAVLQHPPENLDESQLMGNEPAVMISRLKIRNNSTIPNTARYYIKPWKPAAGRLEYGSITPNVENAWTTTLAENVVTVAGEDPESAICYVDAHGSGSLSLVPEVAAVRYT